MIGARKTALLAAIFSLGVIVGFFAILFTFNQIYSNRGGVGFDFRTPNPAIQPYLRANASGIFGQESNAAFGYRWIADRASFNLTYLPDREHVLRLEILGAPGQTAPLIISSRGSPSPIASFVPPGEGLPQKYEFPIGREHIVDNKLTLYFESPRFNAGDGRNLGAVLLNMEVVRTGGGRLLLPPDLMIALAGIWLLQILIVGGVLGWRITRARLVAYGVLLAVLIGQGLWLAWDFARQPFSLYGHTSGLLYDLGRFALFLYVMLGLLAFTRLIIRRLHKRQAPANAEGQRTIGALTGVRFLAALTVFGYHMPASPDMIGEVYIFLRHGYTGVSFFFTLSGFILCFTYYKLLTTDFGGRIHGFLIARLARIYPVYLLSVLAGALLYWNDPDPPFPVGVAHVLGLQTYLPRKEWAISSFNKVSWSVSAEIFFYLLFPALVWLLVRHLRTPLQLLGAGVVVWLTHMGLIALTLANGADATQFVFPFYWLGPGRFFEFVAGVLLGKFFLLQTAPPTRREKIIGSSIALVGFIFFVAIMIQPRDILAVYRYGAIFTPAFCAIIWWLARYSSAFGSVMSRPEWVLLGEASYTFYLFHSMGLDIVTNNHKALPGGFGDYFLMAAALAMTGIFSVVLFIWFETPARHFLRGKLDPKKPAVPNPEISTPSPKPPAMV